MDKERAEHLKEIKDLIHDGVERAANFVEKHHRHAADKPFRVLESIPVISRPSSLVRGVHDGVVSLTYGSIRTINRVGKAIDDWALGRLVVSDDGDDEVK